MDASTREDDRQLHNVNSTDSPQFNKSVSRSATNGMLPGGIGRQHLPHTVNSVPFDSLSREASTVASQLAEVEHVLEQGKRQRSLSRSRRDAELKELQEKLQREAAEKRIARLAQRMGEIPTSSVPMASGDSRPREDLCNSLSYGAALNPDVIQNAQDISGVSPKVPHSIGYVPEVIIGPITTNQASTSNDSATSSNAAPIQEQSDLPGRHALLTHDVSQPSVLQHVKKELQSKLPISPSVRSPSINSNMAPIGGGLGASLSRPRSRSSSFSTRSSSLPSGPNPEQSLSNMATLYRVVGTQRYSVLLMPTAHKVWIRSNDSHVLILPTENAFVLPDSISHLYADDYKAVHKNFSTPLATINVWHGPKSTKFKRVKAMEFAHLIRELELSSRATINEAIDGRDVYNNFWKPIGVQSTEESSEIVKQLSESTTEVSNVSIYDVLDSGKIENPEEPMLSSPRLPNSVLESGKTFVVLVHLNKENVKPLAWIWIGRNSVVSFDVLLMHVESVFKTQTPVRIVHEGSETATFKEHFGQLGRSNSFTGGLGGLSRSSSLVRDKQGLGLGLVESPQGGGNSPIFSELSGGIGVTPISLNLISSTVSSTSVHQAPKTPDQVIHNWNDVITASSLIPIHSITGKLDSVHVITETSVVSASPSIGEFHSGSIYLVASSKSMVAKWIGANVPTTGLSRPLSSAAEAVVHGRKIVDVHQYRESPEFLAFFPWVVYRFGTYQGDETTIPEGKVELYAVVRPRMLDQIPLNKNALWFTPCAQYALRVGSMTYTTFKTGSNELPETFGPVTVVNDTDFRSTLLRVTNNNTQVSETIPQRLSRSNQLPKVMVLRPTLSSIKELSHPTWQDCHDDAICFFDLCNGQTLVWIGYLITSTSFIESAIQLALTYNGGIPTGKIFVTKSTNAPDYLRCLLPGSCYFDSFRFQHEVVSKDVQTFEEYFAGSRGQTFTLEQLQKRKELPVAVDKMRLEAYLSDTDFTTHFRMTRLLFNSLPKWKQQDQKKRLGLF